MTAVLVCRTSWMDNYRGPGGDKAVGGGKYVDEFGFGHESYNFKAFRGRFYGFVTIKSRDRGANIARLGAKPSAESASGVTVIWVATHPTEGGMRVVGWYENATVFGARQTGPAKARRLPDGSSCRHYVTSSKQAVLLDRDDRGFRIRGGSGGIGRTSVWYPDAKRAQELLRYIARKSGNASPRKKASRSRASGRGARMLDIERRLKIELAAMELASEWFTEREFLVRPCHRENLGWDLEATKGSSKLLVEVKGTSIPAAGLSVELTPNEYAKMNDPRLRARFRVFIAANVESKPEVFVFAYSPEARGWTARNGSSLLAISERVSAVLRLASPPKDERDE